MPFINNYNSAIKIITSIENGKCKDNCKKIWVRNLKYSLKSKTNPLKLTKKEKKDLTYKLKNLSTTKNKTSKKYTMRNSPPYPANEHCGKKMKGNDGNMYESRPNKNNICSWKKIN
jgi:hypothetical protein